MKTITTLSILMFFSYFLAQEIPFLIKTDSITYAQKQDSIFTVLEVHKMAVFPGCDLPAEDKMACVKCFSNKLNKEVIQYLNQTYPPTETPKKFVTAQLEFVSNEEGYITQIRAIDGNPEFFLQAINALKTVSRNFKRDKIKIKPAELEDGTVVALLYNYSISLINQNYKQEVVLYLHKMGMEPKEIFNRLTDFNIQNVPMAKIKKWIELE